MIDISNEHDLKDLLEDGSLSIKEKIDKILDEAEYLLSEIKELEYEKEYGDWDCDECYERESAINELQSELDNYNTIAKDFRIISVSDSEIRLENHLSAGQTWNWLPGHKLGFVE